MKLVFEYYYNVDVKMLASDINSCFLLGSS